MSEEKQQDQPMNPELSEKDLEQVSGGGREGYIEVIAVSHEVKPAGPGPIKAG